jgi:hypothetical protein
MTEAKSDEAFEMATVVASLIRCRIPLGAKRCSSNQSSQKKEYWLEVARHWPYPIPRAKQRAGLAFYQAKSPNPRHCRPKRKEGEHLVSSTNELTLAPASASKVGAMSTCAAWYGMRTPGFRPGPRMMNGTRMSSSYADSLPAPCGGLGAVLMHVHVSQKSVGPATLQPY